MGNLMGSWRYKEPSTVEECDSTWETDSESGEHQPGGEEEEEDSGISESMSPADAVRGAEQLDHGSPKVPHHTRFGDMMESSTRMKRSFYAAKDLYKYRHSYPNYKEPRHPNEYRNLRFYLNKIPLVPDGIYIEEILTKWRGDYEKLEHNHTYIQWLFPLREQGLNFYAQELTQDEIKEFQSTREAKRHRFQHLNESQHNYLRITRILKSLGELGFESFKLPLVHLLLEEALVEGTLPNMRHSALEYFVYTLRQHSQRRALLRFAQRHYQPPENFIWGPPKKKRIPASGSTGMKSGKNEVVERSVGKARSPREGRNNLERESDDMDDRKSGEWKTAKGSKLLQEGRGRVALEEYIETIPL
uniref:Opioid growth factor receptor like 1 n=1 Tax=Cyprinus carpio carpio TaxID=630221 RepID=A0A9J8BRZ9_CYPCA